MCRRGRSFVHMGQPECFDFDWQQLPPHPTSSAAVAVASTASSSRTTTTAAAAGTSIV